MTVEKEITRLEHSSVNLTVTVAKDDVRSEYDDLLSEYTKTIPFPGFRKGKVPKNVLIQKFGNLLKEEARDRLIQKSLTAIFEDKSFPNEDMPLAYSSPKIQDPPPLDLEQDLIYRVIYDVFPRVTLGTWQGLTVEVPEVLISDEDIDRELEEVRERNSIVLDKDDGTVAEKDDIVTLDYCELNDQGEVIPDTERQDFVFALGSGLNIYKFDEETLGMRTGETRDIIKNYPEDFEDPELAGKTKKLRLTVSAIKVKKLPDLDDDLAQDVDEEYETLEDLKNSIRERLSEDLEKLVRRVTIKRLLEKILETTPVDIPESMLAMEMDSRWEKFAHRFNLSRQTLDTIMTKTRLGSAESFTTEWEPNARHALHAQIIIETLIEELKIEVTDDAIAKELEQVAEEEDLDLEELKKYYAKGSKKEYLENGIKETLLFEELLAKNVIKPGEKMTFHELLKLDD